MNIDRFLNDPTANCIFESVADKSFCKKPCMLGIDEAGRGPVLGPMVYGCAVYPIDNKTEMSKMEFADSKQLTEKKREEIFKKIQNMPEKIYWITHVLSPNYISNSMLKRSKYNLNALSHDSAIGLIRRAIDAGVNVKEVYLDTVGPPEKYEQKLSALFPGIKVKVSKKADSLFPVVSAASICAKVIRDQCIVKWKFLEKIDPKFHSNYDYGSGYPGDPKTKAFLKAVFDKMFGYPTFIRFGWSTASTVIDKDGYKCNWEESDEDEEASSNQVITNFFAKNENKNKAPTAVFLEHRFLTRVEGFE